MPAVRKKLIRLILLVGLSIAVDRMPLFQIVKVHLLPSQALREAREIARQLRAEYRGWQDKLDACPCTKAEVAVNPRFRDTTNSYTRRYHPGAASEYRTTRDFVRSYSSSAKHGMPTLMPGQQCIYDAEGNLITGGAGAGTPDAYSPEVNYAWQELVSNNSHTYWDVNPFLPDGMTWQEYQRTWIPNNGNACPVNTLPAS